MTFMTQSEIHTLFPCGRCLSCGAIRHAQWEVSMQRLLPGWDLAQRLLWVVWTAGCGVQMKSGSLGINYDDMTKKAQEMMAANPLPVATKREREEPAAEEPAAKVPATGTLRRRSIPQSLKVGLSPQWFWLLCKHLPAMVQVYNVCRTCPSLGQSSGLLQYIPVNVSDICWTCPNMSRSWGVLQCIPQYAWGVSSKHCSSSS